MTDDSPDSAPAPPSERRASASLQNIASVLIILLILVVTLKTLGSLLQPFFIALFMFYLGRPLARKLVEYKVPTAIANLAIILVAAAVLAVFAWIVTAHVDDLKDKAPAYNAKFQTLVRTNIERGAAAIAARAPAVGAELGDMVRRSALPTGPLGALVKALVGTFVGSVTGVLLVIIYLMFLNGEAVTLPRRLLVAYGDERAATMLEVGKRINDGIIRYVYVKSLASLLVAILSTVTLLGFQIDLAVLWGTLVFFGNFIPYLGSFAAVMFPLIICLLQYGSFAKLVVLATVLIGCQILVSNLLEPLFAGQQLNLSPLMVMLSLAFWGWMWGIVGLVLSIPIMMSVKLVLENIPATREAAIILSQVSVKGDRAPG